MASQILVHTKKTFKYEATIKNKIGRGTYGVVFRGQFKPSIEKSWRICGNKREAAIKRVEFYAGKTTDSDIENDREVVALRTLRHPFIVKLLAVEDDENFRNFVFELCQANLEDFLSKDYTGAMTGRFEGLFHMACGLNHIHENNMVHRDIKPENVLISISKNGAARLKISDLGFTKKFNNDDGTHFDTTSGLKGTANYLAAELLRLRDQREGDVNSNCTTSTDVFAAGITFFRYLSNGLHPFGRGYEIQGNIINGTPINLIEGNEKFRWLFNLIKAMLEFEPQNRWSIANVVAQLGERSDYDGKPKFSTWFSFITQEANSLANQEVLIVKEYLPQNPNLAVGEQTLEIDRGSLIGKGLYGTVFRGKFQGNKVTVKRVQLIDVDEDHHTKTIEIFKELSRPKAHPNVLHLMHYEKDSHFRYYVLEFCDVSLPEFIDNIEKYKESMMLKDEQVILQLASGLEHMHSKNIAHRNIRPDNVLISLAEPAQMKWSGFTSSKRTDKSGRCSMVSGIKGTHHNYLAPELKQIVNDNLILINQFWYEEGTSDISIDHMRSDIFSAGCVFFYFVTRGVHPFRNGDDNIHLSQMGRNPMEFEKLVPINHFAHQVIIQMTDQDPVKRIKSNEVIKHLKPTKLNNRLSAMSYSKQNEIFKGSFSHVYSVMEYEGMALAVKKVEYFEDSKENFEKLQKLKHPNVVRLHFFDNVNLECYFGMELCQTSLDKLFLPDDDPKKFRGVMPITDEEFCLQLASGLEYIHKKNLVHGSLKPSNILIINTIFNVWQIKLSDFGLIPTSRRVNQDNTSSPRISGFQDWVYWLAPELTEAIKDNAEVKFTEKSDIFSAGSVFFYFSSKGSHLYGEDVNNIIPNTLTGNTENLLKRKYCKSNIVKSKETGKRENKKHPNDSENFKEIDIFPIGLIRWMTAKEPDVRPKLLDVIQHSNLMLPMPSSAEKLKNVKDIKYSTEHVLGSGGQATVFTGFFKASKTPIAVKRISNMDAILITDKENVYRERDNFASLRNNVNIVKLFGSIEEGPFLFLALEKCLTSLEDYCRKPLLYRGIVPMPPDCEVLLQMAEGLHFIHEEKIIHRDVKPANVLISYDKPAIIKWADFGMSRAVTTGSRTFTWSNLKGTERWMAPELIDENEKVKVKGSMKCDIFALGCVFFFFLTSGKHPFGDGSSSLDNVRKGLRILLNESHYARNIVKGMTEHNRNNRPELSEVIEYLKTYMKKVTENSEITMDDGSDTFSGQNQGFQAYSTQIPDQFTWTRLSEPKKRKD